MRSPTLCLGLALGALWLARASLADDPAPTSDSLARMPANPVTSPAPAEKAASAAPASASPTAPSGAAALVLAPPATPKKICRNMDVLGSKIPKRVCATPEEWASFEGHAHEDTQDGLRRLRDQGAVAPPSPGVSPSQLPPR